MAVQSKELESVKIMFEEIRELIQNCDMILVGIGSGIGGVVADGKQLDYNSSRSYYEKISNELKDRQLEFYNDLNQIISQKNYFVLNTNMDGIIDFSNLNLERVVSPCGSMFYLQCGCNGHDGIHEAQSCFSKGKLTCAVCGKNYVANVHGVESYNESRYLENWSRYNKWLSGTLNKNLVILELGSDFNYASLMRWPFEKVVMLNQKSKLIRVNKNFPQGVAEIKERFISVEMEPKEFLKRI